MGRGDGAIQREDTTPVLIEFAFHIPAGKVHIKHIFSLLLYMQQRSKVARVENIYDELMK